MDKIRTLPESESRALFQGIRQGLAIIERSTTVDASKQPNAPSNVTNETYQDQSQPEELTLSLSVRPLSPGSVRSFGNLPLSSAVRANGYPSAVQARQLQMFTTPEACTLPLNIEGMSSSDYMANSMLGFCRVARSQIAANFPVTQVLSLRGVDLTLFFRDRQMGDPHTVSTWACEWMKAWQFLPSVTRLTAIHYAASFMRWYILPCPENYTMLSPLSRPLKEQLFIPHPVSLDLVYLPLMRQALLAGGKSWIDRVTADSHHLHWSHGTMAAIMNDVLEPGSGSVKTLRPEFIEQCDLLSNWTLHESVLEDYPDLPREVKLHSNNPDPAKYEPKSEDEAE